MPLPTFPQRRPQLGGHYGTPPAPAPVTAPVAPTPPPAPGAVGAAGKALGQGNALIGPDAYAENVQRLYQLLAGSPQFQSILRGASQAGSQAQTAIASKLGATGLGGSGVGAVMGGLGNSIQSNAINQAQGDLFSQAQQITLQSLLARLGITPDLIQMAKRGPSVGQQLLGGAIGAGAAYAGGRGARH